MSEIEKEIEKLSRAWAEKHHISALVQKPKANILFAKKLAAEAYSAGYLQAVRRERARILRELDKLALDVVLDCLINPEGIL